MSAPADGIVATLTAGVSARLRDLGGNAAILGVVALLCLTAWVALVVGFVALLAPLWGIAGAVFFVAAVVIVMALALLARLRQRSRLQKAQTALLQADAHRKSQAVLAATLPDLLRDRPGMLIIGAGLVLGGLIAGIFQGKDEE